MRFVFIYVLVLAVIAFFIEGIEIFRSSSTSPNTGIAPVNNTELAVATNVRSGITTSEPFPIPSAFSDRCSAAVPLDTPTANFAPVNFANIDSNLCSFGPSVSNLEFKLELEFLNFLAEKSTCIDRLLLKIFEIIAHWERIQSIL